MSILCSYPRSLARKFAYHWRTAKSRRTLAASSRKRERDKRSLTRRNTSTSVAEMSMTRVPKFQRKRVTRLPSSSAPSTLHSEARRRSLRPTNRTMTRSQSWLRKWAILLLQPLRAERLLLLRRSLHHSSMFRRSLCHNSLPCNSRHHNSHHSSQRRWIFAVVGRICHRITIPTSMVRSEPSLITPTRRMV